MERSVFAATRFICTYFQRARFPEELVSRVAVNFANALLDGLAVGSNLELRLEINCNGTIALVLVDAAQPFNVSLQELVSAITAQVEHHTFPTERRIAIGSSAVRTQRLRSFAYRCRRDATVSR